MLGIVQQIAQLQSQGLELILVTSGAIATGRDLLNNTQRSPSKQAFAHYWPGKIDTSMV